MTPQPPLSNTGISIFLFDLVRGAFACVESILTWCIDPSLCVALLTREYLVGGNNERTTPERETNCQ